MLTQLRRFGTWKRLGGTPVWHENFVTDSGNLILDVHNLEIMGR